MKNILLIISTLLIGKWAFSQEGEILYKDFDPDTIGVIQSGITFKLDFDQDGENEWMFWANNPYHMVLNLCLKTVYSPADTMNNHYRLAYNNIDDEPLKLGDTIPNALLFIPNGLSHYNWNPYFPPDDNPTGYWPPHYIAVQNQVEDGFCSGWIKVSVQFREDAEMIWVTLYEMAFCTIPNYPLQVGQTSFNWSVEENSTEAIATLHPNPTSGLVTITGQEPKSAEVFNAYGQRVATVQGDDEQMTIDLNGLPAGVYFVNVTDKDGRKCVKRVVKE